MGSGQPVANKPLTRLEGQRFVFTILEDKGKRLQVTATLKTVTSLNKESRLLHFRFS